MHRFVMLLVLAACAPEPLPFAASDTAEPGFDDTLAPYRFSDELYGIDVVWERFDDGIAEGFTVGMAETRSGPWGWYGEDCGPHGLCHPFDGTEGLLGHVDEIDAVVPSATTLFDGGNDAMGDVIDAEGLDRLSFALWFHGGRWDGECVIWGDEPTYYADMGCTDL